jgi:hypothetical protein
MKDKEIVTISINKKLFNFIENMRVEKKKIDNTLIECKGNRSDIYEKLLLYGIAIVKSKIDFSKVDIDQVKVENIIGN